MNRFMFFLIGFVLILASCVENPEAKNVRKAVEAYNQALIITYLEANLERVMPYATENELRKLYPTVLALQTTDSRMVATQDYFKVKKISVSGNQASLKAEEQWTYWWENRFTGNIIKPKSVQKYKIIYKLQKNRDRWVIDALESW